MDFLADLWMPIVISAVIVFFASFLAWMVLPHHKADVKALPNEGALAGKLNELNLAPGTYMWPNCADKKDMSSDEFKARFNKGPWGSMTVLAKKPNFATNLVSVFIFYLVVGVFVAYLTNLAMRANPNPEFLAVFQVAGTAAVMAYCLGAIPGAFFFGKPARFMITEFVDGFVYGLLTAGVFAWLWPTVEATLDAAGGAVPALPGN